MLAGLKPLFARACSAAPREGIERGAREQAALQTLVLCFCARCSERGWGEAGCEGQVGAGERGTWTSYCRKRACGIGYWLDEQEEAD